jgi:hypothetical protein
VRALCESCPGYSCAQITQRLPPCSSILVFGGAAKANTDDNRTETGRKEGNDPSGSDHVRTRHVKKKLGREDETRKAGTHARANVRYRFYTTYLFHNHPPKGH